MPPPPARSTPVPGPTRRELNKAATRQAITDAALGLLRTHGPGNFTVEDIADAAGISRRTFFNYFGSTEAALASVTFGFLDAALRQFRLRPAGEPILDSARAALVELADPMTVAPMAELYSMGQTNPQLSRSELEAWDHCTEQIIDAARERFARGADAGAGAGVAEAGAVAGAGVAEAGAGAGARVADAGAGARVADAGAGADGGAVVGIDELYLRALAGSIISCGKAAMDVWFARCGGDLSPESLSILRQLLIDSMSLLGAGFAGPAAPAAAVAPSTAAPSTPSPDRH